MTTKTELTKKEIQQRKLNSTFRHFEEPIERDGVVVGYRKYADGGMFGWLRFTGYRWC